MELSQETKNHLIELVELGFKYIAIDYIDHLIYAYNIKPLLEKDTKSVWVPQNMDFVEIDKQNIYEELCPLLDTTKCYLIENIIKYNKIGDIIMFNSLELEFLKIMYKLGYKYLAQDSDYTVNLFEYEPEYNCDEGYWEPYRGNYFSIGEVATDADFFRQQLDTSIFYEIENILKITKGVDFGETK